MEQKSFNAIQSNFKKFLSNKLHSPPIEKKKEIISPPIPSLNQRIERIERTAAFGREDDEIGYKISFTDKGGNRKTEIVAMHNPVLLSESISKLTSKIIRNSRGFDIVAMHGDEPVGKIQISWGSNPGLAMVSAVDVEEEYQRRGIGTFLYTQVKKELENINIKWLVGALEGSGVVQIREKVFGRWKTHYFSGGTEISPYDAIRIMDVDFGRVIAKSEIT